MTLTYQCGQWFANGKPYQSLHEAVKALKG